MTKTTGIEPTTEAAGDAPFAGIKARFRVQEANTLLSNAFTLDQAAHNLVYISRWQSHFGGVARPCLRLKTIVWKYDFRCTSRTDALSREDFDSQAHMTETIEIDLQN